MFNVVLTDAQITAMYNSGAGITGLPMGITESTDLVLRFQDSLTNSATLGSGYDITGTDITVVDGLIGVTTGSLGIMALSFPHGKTSSIFFTAQLPHSYAEGEEIRLHVHWMRKDAGDGDILWGLEYVWVNVDGIVGNTTIVEKALPAPTQGTHRATTIAELKGGEHTISSILVCWVYRKGDDAKDTFDGEVFMSELDFHFPQNTPGSVQEFSKWEDA